MLDLAVALKIVTSETVTVVSELPPTLDTADVTSSQRVLEDVVDGIPSNGRNFLNLTLLTPGTSISQGSDGDELNISGQRGIFNNLIVDGADFNNPFYGEQRGGQRPAFTFNQDAIEELVVVNQGATAEFGRSAGGFVTVITKSGTNELTGSAHYFGQWDEIAAPFPAPRGGGASRLPSEPVGRDTGRAARARQGVLLPGLRPAGGGRDQAGDPPCPQPGEPAASRALSAGALAGPVRRRVWADPAHRRRESAADQARSEPRRPPPSFVQVQLHLVGAGKRHLRRRFVGRIGQRDRGRPLARGQRQSPLATDRRLLERTARADGARGPAALVPGTAAPRRGPARSAPIRRVGRPAVSRHRHGLRRRVSASGCRSFFRSIRRSTRGFR